MCTNYVVAGKTGQTLSVAYMPTLPLLAEFFRFYGQILPFRSEFRLFRFLCYLLHVKI